VAVQAVVTESGATALRTAFRCDLADLARAWTRGAVKAGTVGMAAGWTDVTAVGAHGGRAGRRGGYLLGLDPHAPHTHQALVAAATRAGLPPARLGGALRISGTRRMARLVEMVGPAPDRMPAGTWPRYRGRTAC
jgi:hypothetical protein